MHQFNNPWMNPMEGWEQPNEDLKMCENMQLARAYVPLQPYIGLFPLDEALRKGTLFPNLYIPYPIKSLE